MRKREIEKGRKLFKELYDASAEVAEAHLKVISPAQRLEIFKKYCWGCGAEDEGPGRCPNCLDKED